MGKSFRLSAVENRNEQDACLKKEKFFEVFTVPGGAGPSPTRQRHVGGD
jgi:hypothetical protein